MAKIHVDKELKLEGSRQQTASRARALLLETLPQEGYRVLTPAEDQNLRVAFARVGKVLYGKAYDIVRMPKGLDPGDIRALERRLSEVVVCEIKSTAKVQVLPKFKRFFFSLSTAELLVAQSLGKQFKFVFVNTKTKEVLETDLQGLYGRARAVYPSWSVQF